MFVDAADRPSPPAGGVQLGAPMLRLVRRQDVHGAAAIALHLLLRQDAHDGPRFVRPGPSATVNRTCSAPVAALMSDFEPPQLAGEVVRRAIDQDRSGVGLRYPRAGEQPGTVGQHGADGGFHIGMRPG